MKKRVVSISVVVLIIVIGILQKDVLLHIIKEGGILSVFFSMLLVAICVFFPVIPFPLLAGIIGAIFGTFQGISISLLGAMAGTIVFFYLCRYGFQDLAEKKLRKYDKVLEFESFLEKNAFTAILTARLIPVIPNPVVNIVCGISHVNSLIFFIASALGKIPNILILSYAGAEFSNNKLLSFGLYAIYILMIVLINFVFIYRKNRN